jgi:alpha-mannosidase
VYQTFSEWATHVIRLVQGAPYVEVEWTAGPIPISTPWLAADTNGETNERLDKWGKEVIVKYKSGLATEGTFYADANGREMVKRQYNARGASYPKLDVGEPVAGNYYPVNNMIALQDQKMDAELVVLTDVTQGGASLAPGEVELMVHRRIQVDDNRGVQEPLNETMCGCNDINAAPGNMGEFGHEGDGGCECAGLTVRGRHWLLFDTTENAHAERRQLQQQLQFPATLAFAEAGLQTKLPTFSAIQAALPKNVRLMTVTNNYADFNDGQYLVRLAHLYSIGEHKELSQPATVSLADVFAKGRLKIKSAQAMSLTGNQGIEAMDAKKFEWKTHDLTGGKVDAEINENGKPFEKRYPFDPKDPKLSVTLRPMEVKTFFVTFENAADLSEIVI